MSGLRDRNKRARTERILQAARELIRERQLHSVTLDQIAHHAQVAPATIFNLVGSREQLFAALVDQAHDQLTAALADTPEDNPAERVRAIVATLVSIFVSDRDVYRQVLTQWRESGTMLRASPYPSISQALRDGQATGMLRDDVDPDRVAAAVLAGCVGALHQWSVSLISDRTFGERCLYGVDLALAAMASDDARTALAARLSR